LLGAQIAAPLGRWPCARRRLGLPIDRVLDLADGVVELALKLGLAGKQAAQREL